MPSPFFLVYCHIQFLILGQSVGKGKKRPKNREKPGNPVPPVEPGNDKVRLESQHGDNGGRKDQCRD